MRVKLIEDGGHFLIVPEDADERLVRRFGKAFDGVIADVVDQKWAKRMVSVWNKSLVQPLGHRGGMGD